MLILTQIEIGFLKCALLLHFSSYKIGRKSRDGKKYLAGLGSLERTFS